jgi:hypothetical protein
MNRTEQIVRLSGFIDRHRGRLLSLPGVTDVGVGPRTLIDIRGDVVVQIFVRSRDEALQVRERASTLIDPREVEVFVKGNLEPLRLREERAAV